MSNSVTPYEGKVTIPFVKVLTVFLEDPSAKHSGSEIYKRTKLQSGTVYPMLARLVENGWLKPEWEDTDPTRGQTPRRLFKLTGSGQREALNLLSEHISPVITKGFSSPALA